MIALTIGTVFSLPEGTFEVCKAKSLCSGCAFSNNKRDLCPKNLNCINVVFKGVKLVKLVKPLSISRDNIQKVKGRYLLKVPCRSTLHICYNCTKPDNIECTEVNCYKGYLIDITDEIIVDKG